MNAALADVTQFRAGASALAARCLRLMPDWPVGEISHLYEELDTLSSLAGQCGQAAIADAAIELTVYLSSLVDSGLQASPAQRSRALVLAESLAAACGGEQPRRRTSSAAGERSNSHRAVLYLRDDTTEMPGLTKQLGQAGYLVQSLSDGNRALVEARNRMPDALIVESGEAALLGRLLEAAEQGRSGGHQRPLALVLNDSGDQRHRLFAQRAGADLVLEGGNAERVVQRLDDLFVAQRQEQTRILVVDDDRSMALFCQTVLGHKGMATRTAASAAEAFELLAEFRPDLILLDLYLNDMNGIEVAQLIRERPDMAMVPILFMSGEENLDQRFDAIRMGGDDFLLKPVKPRHLIASVSSRVRRSRQLAGLGDRDASSVPAGRSERSTLVHDLARSRRGELGDCVALVLLAVDDVPNMARRLGFVRTGDLAQQIVTQIALEGVFPGGVCVLGEFSFLGLAVASSEGALRVVCEKLRARLQGRGWLSAEAPEPVSFSLAALRVDDHSSDIDDLMSRLSHRLLDAQDQGGGQSVWLPTATALRISQTPGELLARAILKRPLIAETTCIEFRPLLPIQGQHAGQYLARLRLVAPRSTLAESVIDANTYVPIAREIHMLNRLDRWLIDALARRIQSAATASGEIRILVPMSADSLAEPAFADWLLAELRKHRIDGDALALLLDGRDLLTDLPRSTRLLDHLQTTGARIFVKGFDDDGRDAMRLLRLPSSYANIINLQAPDPAMDAAAWGRCRARLVAESQRHGKIVVIDRVDRPEFLSDLFRDNVHYAVGSAIGDWQTDLSSGAAAVTL
ncbi:MAG: response regulator [Lysobacterales bacterium]